jgi:hypothetical protein
MTVTQSAAAGQRHPAAEALLTQETFTRDQVARLMAHAMRWGYENRVAEENAAWPPAKVFTLGRWYEQADERAKADAAARLPRPEDFPGRGHPPLRVAA